MAAVLRRLRIENLVLIREAELELDAGLNAITGETGAGKTILSNAIGLLLGARGDAALIGAAGDEAYVEAEFDRVDDETARRARRAAAGRRGRPRARAPDLRRRAHARLRVGPERRARGRRGRGRGADRDERPVRAAAAGAARATSASVLDAFAGARHAARRARAWRELGRRAARARRADPRRGRGARRGSRSCARSPPTPTASTAGREDELRAERERLRHLGELVGGAGRGG